MTNPPDFVKILKLHKYWGNQVAEKDFVYVYNIQNALAEKCKVITGRKQSDGSIYYGDGNPTPVDTHTAFIFGIEPIKPKDCKHEAEFKFDQYGIYKSNHRYECKHCGEKLKPVAWEVKG